MFNACVEGEVAAALPLRPFRGEGPSAVRLDVVRELLHGLNRADDAGQFQLMVRVAGILRTVLMTPALALTAAERATAASAVTDLERECIRFAPRFVSLRERVFAVVDLLERSGQPGSRAERSALLHAR